MDDEAWLAQRFEENRSYLRAVAYRMLGSRDQAEDAVQETWIRLSRSNANDVANLRGWLTTVIARVSLDMLRSRSARREEALGTGVSTDRADPESALDPESEAVMADSVGSALLIVLETLTPTERLAFVLHDLFGVPFEEISPIVGRSPEAARQLASRARRRVQGTSPSKADPARKHQIVAAFLAASRNGDFDGLLALLDPEAVLRADGTAVRLGASAEVVGADAVANTFKGRARHARLAVVGGEIGAVWASEGRPLVVFHFTILGDAISEIQLRADPGLLRGLEWTELGH
jgi:RNA polymerase sigma factor (sigma-70 family)